jgi:hypothetical protein
VAPGKVSGPGSGPPTKDEGTSPAPAAGVTSPQGPRFADKLRPGEAATGPDTPGAAARISGSTAELAADLQAGRITPRAAIDRVIDSVVDKQLGTDAPAPVRAKLRAALEDAVADDPLLTGKIKALE